MNLVWYARRLSRMSPAEVWGRLGDAWVKQRWRRRQVPPGGVDALPVPEAVPEFASPIDPAVVDALPDAVRRRIVAAADEAVAGRFRFFDRVRDDLTGDPDWFLDPRTGMRAPQADYAFDIDYRRADKVGTVKYVWEPSRHHQLTVMAAAYFVTGNEIYAEAVGRQLRSWWRNNPFLSGIHWTSGIELGVRLISWVWVRRLLHGWDGVRLLFDDNPTFLRQLHHHQEFLATLASHGSSANNHILAEEAGQFAACCAFPYFPETDGWREKSAEVLVRELRTQTFESGINRELASSYHLFVLELMLAAAIEGEASGHPLGVDAWEPVCRMTDALAAMIDGTGRPPRQGDGDDARGLLLDAAEAEPVMPLLSVGATLFGARDWWPAAGDEDLRSLLWRQLIEGAPRIEGRPVERPNLFDDAGIVVLRDDVDGEDEIWCRCDHGPHGFEPLTAHGHADALSVELRCGGVDILADPGTYTYQGEAEWRSYFKSTVGHNCLELDGIDQSVSGGAFMWMKTAQSELISLEGLDSGETARWCAAHDGYGRLKTGARHLRTVTMHRGQRRLVVEDAIESEAGHACRLAFHLGPEVTCELQDDVARLTWQSAAGPRSATMWLPGGLRWDAIRGQNVPPLGWYSPCFGGKTPATTLIGVGEIQETTKLTAEIVIEPLAPTSVDHVTDPRAEECLPGLN